jgi:hypothetical protein
MRMPARCCFTVGAAPVLLDVGSDDHGLDLREFENAALFAPAEEFRNVGIRCPRVPVADIGDEELDEAPGGALAGPEDRGRELLKAGAGQVAPRRDWNDAGFHTLNAAASVAPEIRDLDFQSANAIAGSDKDRDEFARVQLAQTFRLTESLRDRFDRSLRA